MSGRRRRRSLRELRAEEQIDWRRAIEAGGLIICCRPRGRTIYVLRNRSGRVPPAVAKGLIELEDFEPDDAGLLPGAPQSYRPRGMP
jgi:hypothetical protein